MSTTPSDDDLVGIENCIYTRADWRQDVANGDTLLGYWAWVAQMIWEGAS